MVVRNPWGQDNLSEVMIEHDPDPSKNLATRKKDYNPNSWTGDKWDGFINLTYAEFVNSFRNVAITDGAVGTSLVDDNAPPLPQDPDGDFSRATDLGTPSYYTPGYYGRPIQTVDRIGFQKPMDEMKTTTTASRWRVEISRSPSSLVDLHKVLLNLPCMTAPSAKSIVATHCHLYCHLALTMSGFLLDLRLFRLTIR